MGNERRRRDQSEIQIKRREQKAIGFNSKIWWLVHEIVLILSRNMRTTGEETIENDIKAESNKNLKNLWLLISIDQKFDKSQPKQKPFYLPKPPL